LHVAVPSNSSNTGWHSRNWWFWNTGTSPPHDLHFHMRAGTRERWSTLRCLVHPETHVSNMKRIRAIHVHVRWQPIEDEKQMLYTLKRLRQYSTDPLHWHIQLDADTTTHSLLVLWWLLRYPKDREGILVHVHYPPTIAEQVLQLKAQHGDDVECVVSNNEDDDDRDEEEVATSILFRGDRRKRTCAWENHCNAWLVT